MIVTAELHPEDTEPIHRSAFNGDEFVAVAHGNPAEDRWVIGWPASRFSWPDVLLAFAEHYKVRNGSVAGLRAYFLAADGFEEIEEIPQVIGDFLEPLDFMIAFTDIEQPVSEMFVLDCDEFQIELIFEPDSDKLSNITVATDSRSAKSFASIFSRFHDSAWIRGNRVRASSLLEQLCLNNNIEETSNGVYDQSERGGYIPRGLT